MSCFWLVVLRSILEILLPCGVVYEGFRVFTYFKKMQTLAVFTVGMILAEQGMAPICGMPGCNAAQDEDDDPLAFTDLSGLTPEEVAVSG